MPAVVNVTKDQILAEEEAIKEQVYGHFQRKIEETNSALSHAFPFLKRRDWSFLKFLFGQRI